MRVGNQHIACAVAWNARSSWYPVDRVLELFPDAFRILGKIELYRIRNVVSQLNERARQAYSVGGTALKWNVELEHIRKGHHMSLVAISQPMLRAVRLVDFRRSSADSYYALRLDRIAEGGDTDIPPQDLGFLRQLQAMIPGAIEIERERVHSSLFLEMIRDHVIGTFEAQPFRNWGGTYLISPAHQNSVATFFDSVQEKAKVDFVLSILTDCPENRRVVAECIADNLNQLLTRMKEALKRLKEKKAPLEDAVMVIRNYERAVVRLGELFPTTRAQCEEVQRSLVAMRTGFEKQLASQMDLGL